MQMVSRLATFSVALVTLPNVTAISGSLATKLDKIADQLK